MLQVLQEAFARCVSVLSKSSKPDDVAVMVKCNEALGGMLLTWNNLAYYQDLMAGARLAISEGRYEDYMRETQEDWERGDIPAL